MPTRGLTILRGCHGTNTHAHTIALSLELRHKDEMKTTVVAERELAEKVRKGEREGKERERGGGESERKAINWLRSDNRKLRQCAKTKAAILSRTCKGFADGLSAPRRSSSSSTRQMATHTHTHTRRHHHGGNQFKNRQWDAPRHQITQQKPHTAPTTASSKSSNTRCLLSPLSPSLSLPVSLLR